MTHNIKQYVTEIEHPTAIDKKAKWLFWKKVFGGTISAFLAVLGACVTIRNFMPADSSVAMENVMRSWGILIFLFFVCFVLSVIWNWPRLRCQYKDPSGTTVIIEHCDLLKQKGRKIIHVNDAFDIDSYKIPGNTVHGQFIKRFVNDETKEGIKQQIEEGLSRCPDSPVKDETLKGNKDRYPLGTICPLSIEDEDYCLVAFSSFVQTNNGGYLLKEMSPSEYTSFFVNMWNNLSRSRSDGVDAGIINISSIGAQQVLGPGFDVTHRIDSIVDTFFNVTKNQDGLFCNTLRVCVEDKDAKDIDFNTFSAVLKHIAGRPRNNVTVG